MPELPEVETIRRDLARLLHRKTIAGIHVRDVRVLQGFAPSGRPRRAVRRGEFEARLRGRSITGVRRRGKYLLFDLSSGETLLCHLRMTGQLIYGAPQAAARAVIRFEESADALSFCDTRRFGELWIVEDWRTDPSIAALGPEPLLGGWDARIWGRDLRASKAMVQSALLDQRRIAGLGNIYVTEALFHTGIRPTRRCHTLRVSDIPPLVKNIQRVLEQGLEFRGVSFYSYRDGYGQRGGAQKHLSVYGRAGEPCPRCGVSVKGTKVGGRGTAYCPKCQK